MIKYLYLWVTIIFASPAVSQTDVIEYFRHNADLWTSSKTIPSQLERTMESTLSAAGLNVSVIVNADYNPESINVRVLEIKDATSFPTGIGSILSSLEGNAIALPPDVILFDLDFLTKIIAISLSDQIFHLQLSPFRGDAGPTASEVDDLITTVADYTRMRTMRVTEGLDGASDAWWVSLGFGDEEDRFVKAVEKSIEAGIGDLAFLSIAPIFFHEYAHLESGTSGQIFGSVESAVEGIASWFWAPRTKRIEDEADRRANELVNVMLTNLDVDAFAPKLSTDEILDVWDVNPPTSPVEEFFLVGAEFVAQTFTHANNEALSSLPMEAMRGTSQFMRDIVVVSAFHGFRGQNAEDIFHRFYHTECDRDVGMVGILHDFNVLESADRGFYPVITRDEWQEIKSRFFGHVSAKTHSHNFNRAARQLSSWTSPVEGVGTYGGVSLVSELDIGEGLFLSLLNDDPSLIEPKFLYRSNIRSDDLISRLSESVNFEQAVNCEKFDCFVGTFDAGAFSDDTVNLESLPGFLEIVSTKDGYVVFARMVIPLSTIPVDEWSAENLEDAAKQIWSFASSLRFVANIFADKSIDPPPGMDFSEVFPDDEEGIIDMLEEFQRIGDPETPAEEFMEFRLDLARCGLATRVISEPNNFDLEYRTLSTDRWFSIELVGNAVLLSR